MNIARRRAWSILLLILLAGALSGCGINNVPTYKQQVNAAWSQVQNEYQRRADLVPNLVQTVKGYAKQERKVLIQVTKARSRVAQMRVPNNITNNPKAFNKFQHRQAALTGALSRLLVVSERYPDLKSNQNFLTLQSQLEGTENRIAVARRDYIKAVQRYNTELQTIPGKWWADIFYPNAKPKQNFTASKTAQTAPKVKF
jgi:LemA protein